VAGRGEDGLVSTVLVGLMVLFAVLDVWLMAFDRPRHDALPGMVRVVLVTNVFVLVVGGHLALMMARWS
jgi:hypothetical protein